MPDLRDTIVAEATPPGRGSVRVVRLSGPRAIAILKALFEPLSGGWVGRPPRTAVLGDLRDGAGRVMDRCLALAFPGPDSLTGEDAAELQVHGSGGVVRGALDACIGLGARPALPGEFSYRAFLRGKLSLLEAEAVDALTRCETALQAQLLGLREAGRLEGSLARIAERLLDLEARLEAALDFPEDVPGGGGEGALAAIGEMERELVALAETALRSRPLREGWTVALVGAANVGKSSLFNALLRRERALVSPHPGTTRDVISETLEIDGLPLSLLDTAGQRGSDDQVEQLGMEASRKATAGADGTLLIFDLASGWTGEDEAILDGLSSPPIALVGNKADLEPAGLAPGPGPPTVRTSARTGEGLGALHALLGGWMRQSIPASGERLFGGRQGSAALRASEALREGAAALRSGYTEEVALQSLREARRALGQIVGGGDPETLYERIFANFCIGK